MASNLDEAERPSASYHQLPFKDIPLKLETLRLKKNI